MFGVGVSIGEVPSLLDLRGPSHLPAPPSPCAPQLLSLSLEGVRPFKEEEIKAPPRDKHPDLPWAWPAARSLAVFPSG